MKRVNVYICILFTQHYACAALDAAVELWRLLLQGRFEHLDLWIKFIEVKFKDLVAPNDGLTWRKNSHLPICRSNTVKPYPEIHGTW